MLQKQETEAKGESRSARSEGRPPEAVSSTLGVDTSVPMTAKPTPVEKYLIEEVVSKKNMELAYRKVVSNKGSAGIDGMEVNQLRPYLQRHWQRIKEELERAPIAPSR